jgi:hypothetical protein
MKYTLKKITLISAILGFSTTTYANDTTSDNRSFYIGVDAGYSIPLQNKLDKVDRKSVV